MPLISASKTSVGLERPHNEDYIWVNEDLGLFIVADGMGGHEAGEVASQLAATTAAQSIKHEVTHQMEPLSRVAIQQLLFNALQKSNDTVRAEANRGGQQRKMGSTIVVGLVRLPYVYIVHAGDARAYLARENQLTQLTQDDSYVAELVAAGVLSRADAKNHPYVSIVTQAIGQEEPLEPTFTELTVTTQDWLLFCSDGLTGMIDEDVILSHIEQAQGNPTTLVEDLTAAANEAGGKDNISVVAIHIVAD